MNRGGGGGVVGGGVGGVLWGGWGGWGVGGGVFLPLAASDYKKMRAEKQAKPSHPHRSVGGHRGDDGPILL